MKEMELSDIRRIQLELLTALHEFCVKNAITYFLSNGTLLGAVKYQGYIPWDDDIDICMPRSEYDKLIDSWESERYTLFSCERQKSFLFPFAKLSYNDSILIEKNVNNGCQLGVNIDIFPLDGFGNSDKHSRAIFRKMNRYRRILSMAKLQPRLDDGKFKKIAKHILSFPYKVYGADRICKKMVDYARQNRYDTDRYVGNTIWGFYSPGEAHKRSVFGNAIPICFEGKTFFAPCGFDMFLRRLYGNYEKDPPLEKQCTHHGYTAYYIIKLNT